MNKRQRTTCRQPQPILHSGNSEANVTFSNTPQHFVKLRERQKQGKRKSLATLKHETTLENFTIECRFVCGILQEIAHRITMRGRLLKHCWFVLGIAPCKEPRRFLQRLPLPLEVPQVYVHTISLSTIAIRRGRDVVSKNVARLSFERLMRLALRTLLCILVRLGLPSRNTTRLKKLKR